MLSAGLLQVALAGSMLWAAASLALGMGGLWLQAGDGLGRVHVELGWLAAALGLAAASFGLRLVRWWRLARLLAPDLGAGRAAVIGAIGFALTATPGKAGEAWKLYLLRRDHGVPTAASAPILLVEKATEGMGFLTLAMLGGALMARPWLEQGEAGIRGTLGLGLGLAVLVVGRRHLGRWVTRVVRGVAPALERWSHLRHLGLGGDHLLAARPVVLALGLSAGARLCDALALYGVARALGLEVSVEQAMAALGAAGLVGGFSLLPAGIGAVEATMAGLLATFGHELSPALRVVLVARVLILWQWVGLGLGLAVWQSVAPWHIDAKARRAPPRGCCHSLRARVFGTFRRE